ncbi:MAG TPA: hypothetical protein VIZ00_14595 [Streptosporangiaceae bacterium]
MRCDAAQVGAPESEELEAGPEEGAEAGDPPEAEVAAEDTERLSAKLRDMVLWLKEAWDARRRAEVLEPAEASAPGDQSRLADICEQLLPVVEYVLQSAHPGAAIALTFVDHAVHASKALNDPDGMDLAVPLPISLRLIPMNFSFSTQLASDQRRPGSPLHLSALLPDGLNGLWDLTISPTDGPGDRPGGHAGEETPIQSTQADYKAARRSPVSAVPAEPPEPAEPAEPSLSLVTIRRPGLDDEDGSALNVAAIYADREDLVMAQAIARIRGDAELSSCRYLVAGSRKAAPVVHYRPHPGTSPSELVLSRWTAAGSA